jgi:hypothetical protein
LIKIIKGLKNKKHIWSVGELIKPMNPSQDWFFNKQKKKSLRSEIQTQKSF